MGARLYNPATGRFTSLDPLPGGSPSGYAYPTDPVNDVDLDGQCWSYYRNKVRSTVRSWGRSVSRYDYGSGAAAAVNIGVGSYTAYKGYLMYRARYGCAILTGARRGTTSAVGSGR